MQRSRQLLALRARLQAAVPVGGGNNVAAAGVERGWSSVSIRSARQPAEQALQQQLQQPGQATAAANACRAAGPARGFAADAAVTRPGPAPRGASTAGSGRSLWSGLFLLAPGALAAFLGKWQWERREWKRELLERREGMMKGEPLELFSLEEPPAEYRRVVVEGVFDHSRSQFVGPRTRTIAGSAKQGYLLVTPLRQDGSGRAVMVNRGWVPAEWRHDAAAQQAGQPRGKVRVEGILRHGEDPGSFVPPNEPAKGNWFYINTSELASAAGLPPAAPLVEVVTEEPGTYIGRGPPSAMDVLGGRGYMPKVEEQYPLPKSAQDLLHFSVMPQDHLNYAATWWSLSAATLALAVKAIRQGVKPR
ncbi:hypothetical protein ABPG77_001387 [Micractinium sp. CCAP 211/92]